MKCEWVRENITLQVYGELADDARHELEQHVARCADCAAELKAEQEFHALLSQDRAAGADTQPADGFAHASAGSAGDSRAGRLLASAGFRSGELAAAGALLARVGVCDFDSWVRWRRGNFVQSLRSSASG